MKKIIIILLTMTVIGCKDDDKKVSKPDLVTISTFDTRDPNLFKKTVILYEDDEYLISTYFDKYISSYPYDILYDYDEIKLKATQDTLTQDTLLLKNYLRSNSDSEYILAHHLENGSCLIYDKKSNHIIKTIQMEKYGSYEPMAILAGRRFYINGRLFLETVDMIS